MAEQGQWEVYLVGRNQPGGPREVLVNVDGITSMRTLKCAIKDAKKEAKRRGEFYQKGLRKTALRMELDGSRVTSMLGAMDTYGRITSFGYDGRKWHWREDKYVEEKGLRDIFPQEIIERIWYWRWWLMVREKDAFWTKEHGNAVEPVHVYSWTRRLCRALDWRFAMEEDLRRKLLQVEREKLVLTQQNQERMQRIKQLEHMVKQWERAIVDTGLEWDNKGRLHFKPKYRRGE